jgi:hypothetical protein
MQDMWTKLTSLQPEALSSNLPNHPPQRKEFQKMLNVVRIKAKINVKCSNSIS